MRARNACGEVGGHGNAKTPDDADLPLTEGGTGEFQCSHTACAKENNQACPQKFGNTLTWEICIIWGLGVSMAAYLTAGISGAHLNPAITVALCLFANFEGRKVLPYIVSQIAGGL